MNHLRWVDYGNFYRKKIIKRIQSLSVNEALVNRKKYSKKQNLRIVNISNLQEDAKKVAKWRSMLKEAKASEPRLYSIDEFIDDNYPHRKNSSVI